MAATGKQRLVFHCDCNNFFASCECLDHPELKSVPLAVAGDPENRVGVVVAKNELAKKFGGDESPSFVNGVLAKLV